MGCPKRFNKKPKGRARKLFPKLVCRVGDRRYREENVHHQGKLRLKARRHPFCPRFHEVDTCDDAPSIGEQGDASRRQLWIARRAIEQLDAHLRLEPTDQIANHGLCPVKLAGGG